MTSEDWGSENPDDAPPPKKGLPAWAVLLIVASICVVALPCVAIIAAIAIPNLLVSKMAVNETASIQNLKALATAQAQFIKKYDYYSADGFHLNAGGTLIAHDLSAAFEAHQGNGDSAAPVPKAGYVYRMLLGEGSNPKSYVTGNSPTGEMMLSSWGATSRPAVPGTTGENQFYITEAGTVYKQADPMTGKFILDAAPPAGQNPGWTKAR
ncbi:MAG TPA: hypothetical protein VL860_06405 [Planctomycetota bacterium]|nr:hypothetical protein [Planctomycetota bacterium]